MPTAYEPTLAGRTALACVVLPARSLPETGTGAMPTVWCSCAVHACPAAALPRCNARAPHAPHAAKLGIDYTGVPHLLVKSSVSLTAAPKVGRAALCWHRCRRRCVQRSAGLCTGLCLHGCEERTLPGGRVLRTWL